MPPYPRHCEQPLPPRLSRNLGWGVVAGSFVVRDFGEFHGFSFAIGREFGLGIDEARENGVAGLVVRGFGLAS